MDSYKLVNMVNIIKEDEGLEPLSMQELRDRKDETVFLLSDECGYAKVDIDRLRYKMIDDEGVWKSLSGKTFYAYCVRPYTVGL